MTQSRMKLIMLPQRIMRLWILKGTSSILLSPLPKMFIYILISILNKVKNIVEKKRLTTFCYAKKSQTPFDVRDFGDPSEILSVHSFIDRPWRCPMFECTRDFTVRPALRLCCFDELLPELESPFATQKNPKHLSMFGILVTHRRFELRTPWLKVKCSANWANGSNVDDLCIISINIPNVKT